MQLACSGGTDHVRAKMVNKGPSYSQSLWQRFEDTNYMRYHIGSENQLVSVAIRLGAQRIEGWSPEEESAIANLEKVGIGLVAKCKQQILTGDDPLGEALCRLRTPDVRRESGSTYTPIPVVHAMVGWAKSSNIKPDRVVEPGAGSARFLMQAAKIFPAARLLGIETDPVSAIIARANLATIGAGRRAKVILGDFKKLEISQIERPTLYIGNPPYVRHHRLDSDCKKWLSTHARELGLKASQLAGLHVHFFLATALKAQPNDFGIFITSAEWLDVNYGKLVRQLFLSQLGGQGITIIEPTSRTFSDAATTAAITQFQIGTKPRQIRINRAEDASSREGLERGRWLERERFDPCRGWSILSRSMKKTRDGYIELGEICSVHRGQVTGANRVWIAGLHSQNLPQSVLFPSVTKAFELFRVGEALVDVSDLRFVIDIPPDLSVLSKADRSEIDAFLERAKLMGADKGYVAEKRKAWWSVGLRPPAPILATYMARRKPAFVRNIAGARHINIAHGIYPRLAMDDAVLDRLCRSLSSVVSISEGRTYAGGLTKFEPKEMERILIPNVLHAATEQVA